MRLAQTVLILTILWMGTTFAQPIPGDALVVDTSGGIDDVGQLFSVDPTTGDRVLISDFGDGTQGPLGLTPTSVALEDPNNALVTDLNGGTDLRGQLYRVNLTSGDRTSVSDFGNGTQGPLGNSPRGVVLEDPLNALVMDPGLAPNTGLLFRVNLTTGFRTVISDFGNGAQGSLGGFPSGITFEDPLNVLVVDPGAGGDRGTLFRVNLTTGFRTVISDFGNGAQGPLGINPRNVTLEGPGKALVVDVSSDDLFRVDLTSGDRTIVSDFNDGAQGPLGSSPEGVTLDGTGDALVADPGGGTDGRGQLFSVDLTSGDRAIVSNFGDGAQGPLGDNPTGVTLIPIPISISSVPTLSQWGLISMAGLLGFVGFMVMRRRKVTV